MIVVDSSLILLLVEILIMRNPSKKAVLASNGVHSFCKEIIREAENHDPVDAIKDVELALAVLKYEWDKEVAHLGMDKLIANLPI